LETSLRKGDGTHEITGKRITPHRNARNPDLLMCDNTLLDRRKSCEIAWITGKLNFRPTVGIEMGIGC
jgi:hypothetical protein